MHPQDQSPFFRLPAELRAEIYGLSLSSDQPIVEPLPGRNTSCTHSIAHSMPPLGTGLATTCQRINAELDLRPLYSSNTFVLTSPQQSTAFLKSLPDHHKTLIKNLTIDLRTCIDDDGCFVPDREVDWFEYLACPLTHFRTRNDTHCSSATCSHLHLDLPHLERVTIDVRAALRKSLSRSEVNRILGFLLRGSCNGDTTISGLQTCRPGVEVIVVPSGAQRAANCGTCRRVDQGEPWVPSWLCTGEKVRECRKVYGERLDWRALEGAVAA